MRPPTILEGSQNPIRAKADGALAEKGKIDEFEEFEKFPVPPTDSQRASVRSATAFKPMNVSDAACEGNNTWLTPHICRTAK